MRVFTIAPLTPPPIRSTLNVVMRPKMIPPMPESGRSEYSRFKQFAKALLAVPKSEIPTADEALSKLEAEKQQIESKIIEVQRELKKRKRTH